MNPVRRNDVKLTPEHIQALSSADQLAQFFSYLGYPVDSRLPMTPESLQLNTALADATRRIERLSNVEDMLQIYLFDLTSVTVARTQALARAFRDRVGNFLLVLTDDYERLDFVLLEREIPGLGRLNVPTRKLLMRPRILSVDRRDPGRVDLRVLRRFSFTEYDAAGNPEPIDQYDKLRSAYTIAEWSEPLFNNRALFSDYYLSERLPDLPEWEVEGRNRTFRQVRAAYAQAWRRISGKETANTGSDFAASVLETLGFRVAAGPGGSQPDLSLYANGTAEPLAFALAYPWNRYLDGKDAADPERPEENPGAQVVSLLESGAAPWGIVTNGKLWRLYSARAHSRATNYYEIDLEETLASPDPGEAFRYFYLFFRAASFTPEMRTVAGKALKMSFLDWLMEESAAYARELGERLKDRVFEDIFPHFAEGFIAGMGGPEALLRLPEKEREEQLEAVFHGTLTFLYRLLFLLYAESRNMLPVRETRGYYRVSLQRLKEDIAKRAGPLEDGVAARLAEAYKKDRAAIALYERLLDLFAVIDRGSKARNVPVYNGGLFVTEPDPDDSSPEARDARFLQQHRLPDRYLALGLDRLARDVDPKRGDLGFIDYKSLGVRQLGSIYEGLLEFKVRVATEEMAVVQGKKSEEIIPYAEARHKKRKILTAGRGRNARERTLPRGTIYLENDRRERKATGSYYTPDYIVKYIVRETVGPVLDEKLGALRPRLQETEQRFRAVVKKKQEMENVTPDEPALLQGVAGEVLRDLFDITVLDPAMGSGHFLVEAVDHITDRLVRFLDGFPFLATFFEGMRASILEEMERQGVTVDPARLTDVTLLKRHVLKRCIYGVDLNPMAVELAKVSLWLDCFTLGAPLSFLDHHLRWGNSLIGIFDLRDAIAPGSPRWSSIERAAAALVRVTQLADVTQDQVLLSRATYQQARAELEPTLQRMNVRLASQFVPFGHTGRAEAYAYLDDAARIEEQPSIIEKFRTAQMIAREHGFFHWKLEFPEIFIDLERASWEENSGFDAVIGNPPYRKADEDREWQRLRYQIMSLGRFTTLHKKWDLYIPFIELAGQVTRPRGQFGMIVENSIEVAPYAQKVRRWLFEENELRYLHMFPGMQLFEGTGVFNTVFIARKAKPTLPYAPVRYLHRSARESLSEPSPSRKPFSDYSKVFNPNPPLDLEAVACGLGDLCYINKGGTLQAHDIKYRGEFVKDDLIAEDIDPKHPKRYVEGKHIGDFAPGKVLYLEYGPGTRNPARVMEPRFPEMFENPKLMFGKTSGVMLDYSGLWCDQSGRVAVPFHYLRNCDERSVRQQLESAMVDESGRYRLEYLLSIAHSNVGSYHLATQSSDTRDVTPKTLKTLPIRRIHFTTPESERKRLLSDLIARYDNGECENLLMEVEALLPKNNDGEFLAFQPGATGAEEKSDVVHDLLAHLAEQMITMHKQKKECVESFWAELEAASEPGTFEVLRNRGKWEQSLAKAPACRPFVSADSRSTRSLDESLGWNETCFEAFAGMLVGKSNVTPAFLSVYRKHHPGYSALVARIEATDALIDQVVYRLYGLTEEEIAVVEGRS